ncbi:hypothetical protein ACWGQ4_02920 [Streptomyces sp. NPDC055721]|uniref:hypothetical protein n=1 Tax=Streptomyces sp. NPDC127132 TaxID=3345374 RepID=UPI003643D730
MADRQDLQNRQNWQDRRVAVFKAGYIGLVTGACLPELGHRVVVRDIDPDRIAIGTDDPATCRSAGRKPRAPAASAHKTRISLAV